MRQPGPVFAPVLLADEINRATPRTQSALLEAMAMKLPVVSTNVNGIPEAVIDHDTGLLVEAGDSAGLATAVIELAADEALRKKLGDNGRRIVQEKFEEREAASVAWQSYVAAFNESEK